MIVRQLIQLLQSMPQDAEIVRDTPDDNDDMEIEVFEYKGVVIIRTNDDWSQG